MYYEEIETFNRDGWTITVEAGQDIDYLPGRDDDCFPELTHVGRWVHLEDEQDRDYDGQFRSVPIRVSDHHGEVFEVTPEEVESQAEFRGVTVKTARKHCKADAEALVSGRIYALTIRVTAQRGNIEGSAHLGGVNVDERHGDPEKTVMQTVEEYCMAANAIEDAVRSVVGGDAPLALSY